MNVDKDDRASRPRAYRERSQTAARGGCSVEVYHIRGEFVNESDEAPATEQLACGVHRREPRPDRAVFREAAHPAAHAWSGATGYADSGLHTCDVRQIGEDALGAAVDDIGAKQQVEDSTT
jgi:hypothetical protein